MKAIIKTDDPQGVAIDFETEEMKLGQLLDLLPQMKAALQKSGYKLVDSQPAQPVAAATNGQTLSFPVERITATVDDSKTYWRVKGSQFQKYGVIVYEEILEAAGLGALSPLEPFSQPGWTAHYTLKENGKPRKVVKLEKVG